jgi:hypothetical protein
MPPGPTQIGRRVRPGTIISGEFTYSVIEAPVAQRPRSDRRNENRTRSHLREGLVAERLGKTITECRIRDLSRRGARLRLEKDRPLPKLFLLTEGGTGRKYWASLAWQVGRDAGVRLIPIE